MPSRAWEEFAHGAGIPDPVAPTTPTGTNNNDELGGVRGRFQNFMHVTSTGRFLDFLWNGIISASFILSHIIML